MPQQLPLNCVTEVLARRHAHPVVTAIASMGSVQVPYGKSLRAFLVANGCNCIAVPNPSIRGYDFVAFPDGTDFDRVQTLLDRWLCGEDLMI